MKPSDVLKKNAKEVDDILKKNTDKFSFLLKDIPEQIQRRTRLGKGVENNGSLYKLPSLSDKYVEVRKKLKLDTTTKPNRSNLTQSGDMINSISGEQSGTSFTFELSGEDKNGILNSDKAKWNSEKGRRFFDLSSSEKNGLKRKVESIIREILRGIFK